MRNRRYGNEDCVNKIEHWITKHQKERLHEILWRQIFNGFFKDKRSRYNTYLCLRSRRALFQLHFEINLKNVWWKWSFFLLLSCIRISGIGKINLKLVAVEFEMHVSAWKIRFVWRLQYICRDIKPIHHDYYYEH